MPLRQHRPVMPPRIPLQRLSAPVLAPFIIEVRVEGEDGDGSDVTHTWESPEWPDSVTERGLIVAGLTGEAFGFIAAVTDRARSITMHWGWDE